MRSEDFPLKMCVGLEAGIFVPQYMDEAIAERLVEWLLTNPSAAVVWHLYHTLRRELHVKEGTE